jgi:CubicO group peptidase (beta-lactamase class C family)
MTSHRIRRPLACLELAALLTITACSGGNPGSRDAGQTDATPTEAAPVNVLSLLEPIRATYDLPALGGMVISSSEVIALGVTGVRKRGDTTLATVDDQWHLGSDTKAMTATIVARLAERNVVSFDDPLSKLFPNEVATMDPAYAAVPLRWLLSHRSGMGDVTDYPDVVAALATSTDPVDIVRAAWTHAVLALPPLYPPDTAFLYSNSGYIVAGAALERATGKTWETLIADEVFGPLDMASCGFGAPGNANAVPVDDPWGHSGTTPVAPGPDADNPPAMGPAGTVHCSLRDWSKFIVIFLGAKPEYLSAASRATLTTPAAGADYALGWDTAVRPWAGGVALNHAGSNNLWFADLWVAPVRDRAFVTVTNRGDYDVAFPASDAAVGALIGAYLP